MSSTVPNASRAQPAITPIPVDTVIPDARPFKPDLDLAELSDRNHPGHTWTGRGESLSKSHMVFRSRSLCYVGRRLIIAVHLIDSQPALLVGKVLACEYLGECQHRTILQLETLPAEGKINEWLHARAPKRR